MRAEIERRYGDDARIDYYDAGTEDVRSRYATLLDEIEKRGLLYPVTVVDGMPLYDGAVSYPAILRAVHNKLADREEARPTGA